MALLYTPVTTEDPPAAAMNTSLTTIASVPASNMPETTTALLLALNSAASTHIGDQRTAEGTSYSLAQHNNMKEELIIRT